MLRACYIVSGGKIDDELFYKEFEPRHTICADSGLDNALKVGLIPDVVIGDFDSISSKGMIAIENLKIEKIEFPKDKDMTDTDLAIEYAIKSGFEQITILGALGDRVDHSLSNILNLYKYKDYKIDIVDSINRICLLVDDLVLYKDNSYYSIIALSNAGLDLSLKGFKYSSEDLHIDFGSSLAISNEISDKEALISVKNGFGLLIQSKDRS